jgi:hypothetical protein
MGATLPSGERYDEVRGGFYVPARVPLPRVGPLLPRWWHRCPDGTVIRASGQLLSVVGVVVYRFTIAGQPAGMCTARHREPVEPDWSGFDRDHPACHARAGSGAPVEREPPVAGASCAGGIPKETRPDGLHG